MRYIVAFAINEHLLTPESKSYRDEITRAIWNVSASSLGNDPKRINDAIEAELWDWHTYHFPDGRISDFHKGNVILEVQLTGYPQVDLSKLRMALRGDYTSGEFRSKFNCAVIVMPSNAFAKDIGASPNYEATVSGMEADALRYADQYQGCIMVYLLYDYDSSRQQGKSISPSELTSANPLGETRSESTSKSTKASMQVPSTTILSNQAPIVVPPSHTSSQPSLNTAPLSQQIPVLPTPSPKGASRPSRSIINPKMILLVALAILIILGSIIGLYAFNTRTATNKANATATTLTDNNATAQAARATDQAVATAQDAFQATEQANAATQAADQALAQAQANDNATATSQAQANNDATATAQANIPPSQRYIYIGGLDIGGYCQSIGDAGSSLDGNTTWSWSCITSSGTHTNFDVSAVCRWQYIRNDVIAIAANFTNPSSLGCYTIPPNDIGGIINLSAYCQSLGDTNVSLDGTTSYDWHCDTPSGDHVGIDMMKACQWTYNRSDVTAIMVNLNDPGSWRCYTAS